MDIDYMRTLFMLREGRTPWEYSSKIWYCRLAHDVGTITSCHEVESWFANKKRDVSQGRFFWPSEEALLKSYCEFYKLGTHGGNSD